MKVFIRFCFGRMGGNEIEKCNYGGKTKVKNFLSKQSKENAQVAEVNFCICSKAPLQIAIKKLTVVTIETGITKQYGRLCNFVHYMDKDSHKIILLNPFLIMTELTYEPSLKEFLECSYP